MRIRSISRSNICTPLALPPGELSPKVTERALHPGFPSPSSLRSATSPKGRGKGGLHGNGRGIMRARATPHNCAVLP